MQMYDGVELPYIYKKIKTKWVLDPIKESCNVEFTTLILGRKLPHCTLNLLR